MNKIIITILLFGSILPASRTACALPADYTVESGQATFDSPDPATLNIRAGDNAVINFRSFDIAANEAVNFIQPSVSASVLGRVTGGSESKISGSLFATGNLFFVNPSGMYIAPSASIRANTIVLSTLDINTNNFVNRNYVFERDRNSGYSRVVNEGRLNANNIAVLGSAISNAGDSALIAARVGTVSLASGDKVTLSFDARGLIQVAVDEQTSGQVVDASGSTVKDAIKNSGHIEAGVVYINAQTARGIFENAVNLKGVIKATGLAHVNGVIQVVSNENINIAGTLEAPGGRVDVRSGESIAVSADFSAAGDTTLAADQDIAVNGNIVVDSGDLKLLADNDVDGVGSFKQAAGTIIATIDRGDIIVQASGQDNTIGTINAAGSLKLQQGGAPVVFSQLPGSHISNNGSMLITAGVTLNAGDTLYEIGRDWVNWGTFNADISKVSLISIDPAQVLGNKIFYDLSVIVPGKIVRFDSQSPLVITGTLKLQGGYGKLLTLSSVDPLQQWSINPSSQTDIRYILISNCVNIRGPPLEAVHSSSLGNNFNFNVYVAWSGEGATANWSDSGNWDTGTVPTGFDSIAFDGIMGSNPNRDSIIDPSFFGVIDTLNLNGYSGALSLARDIAVKGDFNHQTGNFDPAAYTVSFIDASRLSAISGSTTFYNFNCLVPGKTLQFEAGTTQTILNDFVLQGAYANLVTLVSSEARQQWIIDPRGARDLNYVGVVDSINIDPIQVYIKEGTNRGNCINWDPVATWTGTTSALWSVGTNWSSGVAPGPGDDLLFPAGASNLSTTNDYVEGSLFNSITFSGNGYSLSGNAITLGAGLAGITDSTTSGGNTIGLNIDVTATRMITVTNSGETLTISGMISNAGGIVKTGDGKLVLSGANTYAGTTSIYAGALNIQNAKALGTIVAGTTVFGGAALEMQGGIVVGAEPLSISGTGVSNGGALRNVLNDNTWGGVITVVAGNGPEIASDSGTLTITGGVSAGNLPFIVDGAGNVAFSMAPIATGTGTVTKNGAGTLTLNFPNTYTGTTTINAGTLLYGVSNAISSGAVTVNGGTLNIAGYSDVVGAVTLSSGTITGTTGILIGTSYTVQSGTISAILSGVGAMTKNTTGTVVISSANLYSGATTVSAGVLTIQDSAALGAADGATTVASGATLQIDGSGLSIAEPLTISGPGVVGNVGALRNLANNNTWTDAVTLGAAATITSDAGTLTITTGGISIAALGLTIDGNGDVACTTAPILGTTGTLTKNGAGTLTLGSVNTYTGATAINGGTVILNDSGSSVLSAFTVNSGAALTLDNSVVNADRLGDSLALTMNGGSFKVIGNAFDDSTGLIGALTLSSGANTVTITPGAGGETVLICSSLTISLGATVLFRGTNFGSDPGPNVSTLRFAAAPALTGGGGAENSATVSIIAGAFGDSSLSGTGTDMVTYNVGNTNGLRLLNGAGFSGEYLSNDITPANATNANVRLSTGVSAQTVTLNSLILDPGGAISDAGVKTITFKTGNILGLAAGSGIGGANTVIAFGAATGFIRAPVDFFVSAPMQGTGGLTTSGSGTITFVSVNTYTGLTAVNEGTLLYAINGAINSGAVTVNGGILDIATFIDTVGAVTLTRGTITGTSGILTGASYTVQSGIVSAILAGAVTLTKSGIGTVTLTRNNTYTGATSISAGILKLGAAGDGTNTPLGTTAAGTTVTAVGAVLDLNGYTLSTAEGLTINSTGIASGGALVNSSGSAAGYSGAIIIGSASRINANAGDLSISGGISGASALTVGGAGNLLISGVISTVTSVTKDGTGTLTLSGDNSCAGTITVSVGTLKLGAAGGAVNGPLGTTVGATSVTSGAVLDLNGYTLGTAEPLTLNGAGINNGGALINSSGTAVTYSGLLTLGSASTVAANAGDINLTAAGTVGGAFGLTLGGTGNGTLASILGIAAGTVSKIDSGAWTLSGASTYTGATLIYAGTLKLGAAGGVANTPLGTTGNATTVYSGAALDLNGYTLGTAEGLNLNGMGINSGGALVNNSAGAAGYSGARVLQSDSRITNSGAGLLTLSGGTTGAFNLYIGGAGNTTVSASMSTGGITLTKDGAGTLTLSAANGYTGVTTVNAGTLKYGILNTLSSGNVVVNGGTFDIAGFADTVGTVTMTGGTITNSGAAATLTSTGYTVENGTISAVIGGAVTLVKNTTGTVTMTAAESYSGATTINAGTIELSGAGTAVSSAFTINLAGTLTLDNSGTNVASRLGDALVVTMNGGNFNFKGSPSAAAAETIGQFAFASGDNTVTVTPGSGGATTLTVANNPGFNRSAGATVLFRGTNLGSAPGANVSTLMFTTAPTLTGGGGGAGSTTISIIRGAFGDGSLTGTGTDMVTYGIAGSTGLRLLAAGEYAANFGTLDANVKLTGAVAAANQTINSLIVGSGGSVTDAGAARTLTFTTGNILGLSGNGGISGANTLLTMGAVEWSVRTPSNLTISAQIAGTSGLSTGGSAVLTLSYANGYTGTTYVNTGTFRYGITNALSSGNVTVIGGTYDLNGYSDTIGALAMTAGTVTTGAGTLTIGGNVTGNASILSATISGNLDVGTGTRTFTIADGLVLNDMILAAVVSSAGGAFGISKAGAGTMIVSGSSTYTGTTTVSAGTLKLGAAGGGTNTPLGTTLAGTTVSATGAALDLNGYTLGTSEGLTLNGTGITATSGALMNSSGTAATYSGLIALGSASTIAANYGDINLTNAGTISGATFGLTLRGAGIGTLASIVGTTTGTVVKNDTGTWTLSGSSTYTGATTISAGVFKIGAAGDGTNTPLGTTGTGTTVSSGAVLDLNGYTLSTSEGLTISGTGIATGGALMNSAGSSVDYSGLLALGAASTIVANYGDINLTNAGTITGATFGLTLSGAGNGSIASIIGTTTGTVIKNGGGTWTLSGSSTYTGATTINTGVLKLGATGGAANTPLGTTGTGTTVTAGGVLDLNGYTLGTAEGLTLNGMGINNGGALTNSSASAVSYSGLVALGSTGVLIEADSGAINLTNAGTISGATFALWLDGAGGGSIASIIGTTSGTVTKNGGGTWTISGVNTYTGLTRVNAGTLKYAATGRLADTDPITVSGGTLDIAGVADTVGAVTLKSGAITDSVGGAILTGTSYTVEGGTVNVILAGAAVTLVKNTAGIVTLSKANTYAGLTTVNAGTLAWGINNALSTGAITLAGGIVDIGDYTDSVGTVTLTRNSTITGGNGVLTSTANFALQSGTVSAILSGGVIGITKTTAGTVTLTRANTFSGASSIAATSVLNIRDAGALGTGTVTITITSGGVLQLQGGITVANTKTLSMAGTGVATTGALRSIKGANTWQGPITMTLASRINCSRDSLTISGNISGNTIGLTVGGSGTTTISGVIGTTSGTVTKDGAGTLILTNNNSYTGLMTISAGTIKLGGAGSGANTPLGTVGGATSVTAGATLDLNGYTLATAEPLTLRGTGVSSGGALTNTSGTAVSYSGLITLGSDGASVVVNNGDINLTNAGTITGATFGLILGGSGSGTLSSILGTTSGTLTKSGAGTWTVSGNSTYTGLTTISAGILKLGGAGSGANTPLGTVGSGTVVSGTGAALDLNGYTLVTAEALTLNGTGVSGGGALMNSAAGSVNYSGLITLGGPASIEVNNGTINVTNAGIITGSGYELTLGGSGTGMLSSIIGTVSGALTKAEASTWSVSGTSTYSGATTISAGTLKLGAAGVIPDTSAVTVSGILDMNAKSETIGSLAGNGTVTSSAAGTITLTAGGDGTDTVFSGVIQNGSGTVSFTKTGAGTMTLGNAFTFGADVTANGGILLLAANVGVEGNATVSSGALDLSTFTLNRSTAGGVLTVSAGGTLKLAGSSGGQTGSNFPMNFSTISLNTAGTVEYNSAGGVGQTIYATPDYGHLTLSRGSGAGTTTKTAGNALTVKGNLSIGANTIFDTGNTLDYPVVVTGNWSNSGTFTPRLGTVTFDAAAGTQTVDNGSSSFYALTHSGAGILQISTNGLVLTNNLNNSAGTLDLNGKGLSVAGTVSNAANIQLQGVETVTLPSGNDSSKGAWTYVGRNIAEELTISNFGANDYFNLVINDANTNKATYILGSALKTIGALHVTSGTLDLKGNNIDVTGTLSNAGTIRLQGNESVTLPSGNDCTAGTWEYLGRNIAETLTIKDFGTTDYYNLKINDTHGTAATFNLGAPLTVAGTLTVAAGTLDQGAYAVTTAAYVQSGGQFTGGSASVTVNGAASITGGLMLSPSGEPLTVSSMVINAPGIVRLTTNGRLVLSGSGTPLSGTGTLDLSTFTPNSVEYTGQGTTDIATAGPLSSYYNLLILPNGIAEGGTLTLTSGGDNYFRSAVVDTVNGYAYFAEDSAPGRIVKVRLSDMTSVGVLTLNQGEDSLLTGTIDQPNGFAYFGTYTSPGKVIKIQLSDFTRNAALSLNSGEEYLISSAIDTAAGFAYFGTDTYPGRVIKIQLSDFTRSAALTLNGGEERLLSAAIDPTGGYLYMGAYTAPGKIIKIRLSDFTRNAVLALTTESYPASAAIDTAGGYVYFGTDTSPGKVVKVRLSDFTRNAAITLPAGEENLMSALIDTGSNLLYFTTYTSPSKIVKVRIADFQRDSALTLNAGDEYIASAAVIDPAGGYAYFGTVTSPGEIIKVKLSDFSRTTSLTMTSAESALRSAVIDTSGGYAYFGTDTSPGIVIKIRLSDFTRVGALMLNPGESYLASAVIDPGTGFAYFGTYTDPGIVVRVKLSDFSRDAALPLSAGNNKLLSAAIDTSGATHYAYFGTATAPGTVVKVDLTAFSYSTLAMSSGENYLYSAVIDPSAGYVYFGTNTTPGKVIKIKLSDFSRNAVLSLNTGEDYLASAVIDTAGGYAYFGTFTNPGIVVKVRLSDFTRYAALVLNSSENGLTAAVIDPTHGFAYFGTSTARGRVVKVNLFDFTRAVSYTTLSAGLDYFSSAVIDVASTVAYFGTNTIPGGVVKIIFGTPVFNLGSGTLNVNNELTIGNSASVNAAVFNPVINVNGNFLIQFGGFFTASGSSLFTVNGDWTNLGTFTHSSGSVALGGGDQAIFGSTTFYNLEKIVSSSATLTFEADTTTVIAGMFTLHGAAGNVLSLRSSAPNTQWKLNVLGSYFLDYLDVQDSNSLGGTLSATHSFDALRNTNWAITP